MDKIFCVYAGGKNSPDGGTEVFLNLPATPYEMLDALGKLRLDEGAGAKFRVAEYDRFASLAPFLNEPSDLYELNALAQKLTELDDQQVTAFEGLLAIEIRTKETPVELPDLIDLAYSTGCCHVVDAALNDSQLGRFCAENGFVPGAEELPDNLFDLLDFERIGREHRQREGGFIVERTADHPGGYVEQHSELVQAYQTLDFTPTPPDYTILLKVSGCDNGQTIQLKLPAAPDALEDWGCRAVSWNCLDCKVPSLIDAVSGENDLHAVNRLARQLADMEPGTLEAYKALLSATDCQDIQRAGQLIDTLNEYMFSPQVSAPIDIAKEELFAILCETDREQIMPHLDLYRYGQELIQQSNGVLTEYGLVERTDGQPIQDMEQRPQQGGMEMS